jgi:hypothetical protein
LFFFQHIEIASNPELMKEMMRANDRALANIENIPEGFNELRKLHHVLDTSLGLSEEWKKGKYERLQERWAPRSATTLRDEWTQMFSKASEILGETEPVITEHQHPLSVSSSQAVISLRQR